MNRRQRRRTHAQYDDDDDLDETARAARKSAAASRKSRKRGGKKTTIYEIFEPSELERGHFTDQDQEIRGIDQPERFQLRGTKIENSEDGELDLEALWIYEQAFEVGAERAGSGGGGRRGRGDQVGGWARGRAARRLSPAKSFQCM